MKEVITACLLFAVSAGSFVLSARSFLEKGFLLNNAYIWASKEEREKMDKKPHYKQSAVVFLLLAIAFLLLGIMTLTESLWLLYVVLGLGVLTILYAFVSGAKIENKKDIKK